MTTNLYDTTPDVRVEQMHNRILRDLSSIPGSVTLTGRTIPVGKGWLFDDVVAHIELDTFNAKLVDEKELPEFSFLNPEVDASLHVMYDQDKDTLSYLGGGGNFFRPVTEAYDAPDVAGQKLVSDTFEKMKTVTDADVQKLKDAEDAHRKWDLQIFPHAFAVAILTGGLAGGVFALLGFGDGGIVAAGMLTALISTVMWVSIVEQYVLGGKHLREELAAAQQESSRDRHYTEMFYDLFENTTQCSAFISYLASVCESKEIYSVKNIAVAHQGKSTLEDYAPWRSLTRPVITFTGKTLDGWRTNLVFDGKGLFHYENDWNARMQGGHGNSYRVTPL